MKELQRNRDFLIALEIGTHACTYVYADLNANIIVFHIVMYILSEMDYGKEKNVKQKGVEFKWTKWLEKTNKQHQRGLPEDLVIKIVFFKKLQGQKSFTKSFTISGFNFNLLHFITLLCRKFFPKGLVKRSQKHIAHCHTNTHFSNILHIRWNNVWISPCEENPSVILKNS